MCSLFCEFLAHLNTDRACPLSASGLRVYIWMSLHVRTGIDLLDPPVGNDRDCETFSKAFLDLHSMKASNNARFSVFPV